MATQETSQVDFYGLRGYIGLVGQIFFPFDGYQLDPDDIKKLDVLINKYIIALLEPGFIYDLRVTVISVGMSIIILGLECVVLKLFKIILIQN